MRNVYHPESFDIWERNLLQTGGSLQRNSGIAYQRGGVFRSIWPAVKKLGIAAGKEALQPGYEATRDYVNES